MAIRTREEILNSLNTRFGDDNSDEVLAIIEDVTDTFTDLENRANGDGVDWKQRFEDNDREWRTRYRERFMAGDPPPNDNEIIEPDEPLKAKTFAELFKTEED